MAIRKSIKVLLINLPLLALDFKMAVEQGLAEPLPFLEERKCRGVSQDEVVFDHLDFSKLEGEEGLGKEGLEGDGPVVAVVAIRPENSPLIREDFAFWGAVEKAKPDCVGFEFAEKGIKALQPLCLQIEVNIPWLFRKKWKEGGQRKEKGKEK